MGNNALKTRMNRPVLALALIFAATAALSAQKASQNGPYEGTSNPPPDDMITTSSPTAGTPQAKPPAGQPVDAQPAAPSSQVQPQGQPRVVDRPAVSPVTGNDDGIVQVEPEAPAQPGLNQQPGLNRRTYANDPDGDIVHPAALGPGELGEGTTIRVRLLGRLSTADSADGETFRTRVASDVLQGGQVLIPAGSEIDGRIAGVSSGHVGGHGSMILRPETVTLPDGSRYRLYAQTTGAPGSKTRVGSEGAITPDSRLKRDGIEYGGAVGGGAVTGAILGGPVGALTGGLVGAGVITTHLLISHPQATLDSGTVLLFTLTERLRLVPATESNNNDSAVQ